MFPEMAQLKFKQSKSPKNTNGKSFRFDFAAGDFILLDGKPVVIDDLEALKIWVEKIIRTEKYKYMIYERVDGNEYGLTLVDLIGSVLPLAFVEAELKREINEAVTSHPRIVSISDLSTERDGSWGKIAFKINLTDGQTIGQEVIVSE